MNETIEDGVGECRVVELAMLVCDRHLAGDDDRPAAVAIVEDLEDVAAPAARTQLGS